MGDDYVSPSAMDLDVWEQVLKNLWEGKFSIAQSLASSIFYDLTTFMDATGQIYYILESRKENGNHWGRQGLDFETMKRLGLKWVRL